MSAEFLNEKLEGLLDAVGELREFHRIHGAETTWTAKEPEHGRLIFEMTGPPDLATELGGLNEKCKRAKAEYEAAIRKDERERIKAIIDND